MLAAVEAAFDVVGDLIGRNRHEAGDRRGDARRGRGQQVRLRPRAVEAQGRRRARAARRRSCTSTAQCVADLNLVLSPFLPFSANEVDRALGGAGDVAPMPRIEEADDLDGGRRLPDHHRRLHRASRRGARHPIEVGHAGRPSRRRSSPSSTRRSSTRSSPGWGPDPYWHPSAVNTHISGASANVSLVSSLAAGCRDGSDISPAA